MALLTSVNSDGEITTPWRSLRPLQAQPERGP